MKAIRFVYFIQASTGEVKIGLAVDATSRLATLQIGCPGQLSLLVAVAGTDRAEAHLHKKFEHCRLRGEWFHPAPDLMEYVAQLQKNPEAQITVSKKPNLPRKLPDKPKNPKQERPRPMIAAERSMAAELWQTTMLPIGSAERRFAAHCLAGWITDSGSVLLNFMLTCRSRENEHFVLSPKIAEFGNHIFR